MNIKINHLAVVLVIIGLMAVPSCTSPTAPGPDEQFATRISRTYGLGTVTQDGKDVTSAFPNFTLKFNSDMTYATTGSPLKASVLKATGNFAPQVKAGSAELFDVLLDNQTVLTVTEATETSLKFSLQYSGAGSRTSSISGNYLFTLTAK